MTSTTNPRRRASLALLLALITLGLPLATSSQASAVVPTPPAFGASIEDYPSWTSEKGCNAGVRPGITATIEQVLKPTYGGGVWDYLGQRVCSPSKESAHDDGKALDWMMGIRSTSEKAKADAFVAWLTATDEHGNKHAMARRLGIMYIIWNDRMLRMYHISDGWQPYRITVNGVKQNCSGQPAVKYDTTCHRDHVHISFTPAGAAMTTSYWTAASTPVTPTPTVPTIPTLPNTPTTPTAPVVPAAKLQVLTPAGLVTKKGSTVHATGKAKAGDHVHVYVKPVGKTAWVAILGTLTADENGEWTADYTTSRTHQLQVRAGTRVSNTVTVAVK